MNDEAEHVQGLSTLLGLLFPPPAHVSLSRLPRRRMSGSEHFLALPSLTGARVLLPAGRAAASALRHSRHPRDRRSRAVTSVASTLLRVGAGELAPSKVTISNARGNGSLISTLQEVVGESFRLGIFLGPPRANRKPVLQLLGRGGDLLAVVKVGVNDLTRALARNEARALVELARRDTGTVTAPRLMFHGELNGLDILVQSALPLGSVRAHSTEQARTRAMVDLARSTPSVRAPLGGSGYVGSLAARLAGLPPSPVVASAQRAIASIDRHANSIEFTSWHGDWTPWNMAQTPDGALVWDWERFEDAVPAGYDSLHWSFQVDLRSGADPRRAGLTLLDRAADLLTPYGVPSAAAGSVALLYLVHLGTRYLADGQSRTGITGGRVEEWLEPALSTWANEQGREVS